MGHIHAHKPARALDLTPVPRRHLRDLLLDEARLDSLYREHRSEHGTLIADFGRQRVTQKTMGLLHDLADVSHDGFKSRSH